MINNFPRKWDNIKVLSASQSFFMTGFRPSPERRPNRLFGLMQDLTLRSPLLKLLIHHLIKKALKAFNKNINCIIPAGISDSVGYITRLAADNGFLIQESEETPLRMELGKPVNGLIALLKN